MCNYVIVYSPMVSLRSVSVLELHVSSNLRARTSSKIKENTDMTQTVCQQLYSMCSVGSKYQLVWTPWHSFLCYPHGKLNPQILYAVKLSTNGRWFTKLGGLLTVNDKVLGKHLFPNYCIFPIFILSINHYQWKFVLSLLTSRIERHFRIGHSTSILYLLWLWTVQKSEAIM